jgi:amino acid permease
MAALTFQALVLPVLDSYDSSQDLQVHRCIVRVMSIACVLNAAAAIFEVSAMKHRHPSDLFQLRSWIS